MHVAWVAWSVGCIFWSFGPRAGTTIYYAIDGYLYTNENGCYGGFATVLIVGVTTGPKAKHEKDHHQAARVAYQKRLLAASD